MDLVRVLACVLALTAAPLLRAEAGGKKPAGEKVFAPTDLPELRPLLGQTVAIEGTIARAGQSKTKTVRYLNFTSNNNRGITLVFFAPKSGDDPWTLPALEQWIGKRVRATGKVEDYRGSLQIKVQHSDQLKELP